MVGAQCLPGLERLRVRFKHKTHRIPEDGYAMGAYLAALERLFAQLSWPWRFELNGRELWLVATAASPVAKPVTRDPTSRRSRRRDQTG